MEITPPLDELREIEKLNIKVNIISGTLSGQDTHNLITNLSPGTILILGAYETLHGYVAVPYVRSTGTWVFRCVDATANTNVEITYYYINL